MLLLLSASIISLRILHALRELTVDFFSQRQNADAWGVRTTLSDDAPHNYNRQLLSDN
jgi:hypothetical protein